MLGVVRLGWIVELIITDVLETRHFFAIEHGFGEEHFHWAHPHLSFAVQRDVHDHFFQRLGMGGGADDSVVVA